MATAGVADPDYSGILQKYARTASMARNMDRWLGRGRNHPKHADANGRLKSQSTAGALDLEADVFRRKDPHRIALSLKRSAERSKRRKGTPYQSAMSMLNFYIDRAGKNLSQNQKRVLERAKDELREAFASA